MKFLLFTLIIFGNYIGFTQITVYQDVFNGGIIAQGGSAGMTLNGSFNFDLSLPIGSTLRKAILISTSLQEPDSTLIRINNNLIDFDLTSKLSNVSHPLIDATPSKNYYTDITELLDTMDLSLINFTVNTSCPEQINCGFDAFGVFVLYDKASSPSTCFSLLIPNKDLVGFETYSINDLNPINNLKPVAFSVYMDRSCDVDFDGSYVTVNGTELGLIYGSDIQNSSYLCAGTQGNFMFDSLIIIGLQDDIPDFQMQNQDALSDISSIVSNNQTNLNIVLKHYNINSGPEHKNVYLAFPLAYSTPCQPQNVSITPDTTICPNAPFQLSASGGIAYEWLPEVGLSCYDCPNPVFSGDSSRLYTVRIWGSDSCSVVRPVMIHVRKQPKTTFYNQTTTLCGVAQALINWQTAGNNSYALNDGVFQSTGVFNQVAAGNQLLTVRDAFGCRFDTLVAIDSYLVVNAGLLVSPTSGVAPLEIQIANQSTNFTDWSWRVNNAFQSNVNSTFQAVTGGNYEIELIAWQNDSTCADTAVQNVFISETGFYIFGSSLVVGSSISQNTFFVYTNGKPQIDISIYDAQGRLLKTKTTIQLSEGANAIWNSSEMAAIASEMVFYKIHWQTASDSGALEGKTVVLR